MLRLRKPICSPWRLRPWGSWCWVGTSATVGTAIILWVLVALHTVRFRSINAGVEVAHTFGRSFAVLAGIAGATLLMVSGTILITTLGRLFSRRKELFAKAHERESFFNNLAEAIPGIVWIADDKGRTTYINRHWYEMTGADRHQSLGSGWMESVHPDDRQPMTEKWEKSRQSGETFEIEYRLLDAKKGYRWHLDRAVPTGTRPETRFYAKPQPFSCGAFVPRILFVDMAAKSSS